MIYVLKNFEDKIQYLISHKSANMETTIQYVFYKVYNQYENELSEGLKTMDEVDKTALDELYSMGFAPLEYYTEVLI